MYIKWHGFNMLMACFKHELLFFVFASLASSRAGPDAHGLQLIALSHCPFLLLNPV